MDSIFKGSTDVTLYFVLVDSTTGLPETGVAHTSVTGSYVRNRGTRTAISMVNLAAPDSAHSDGGWEEVDSTNQPGLYRFDIPDAAFATGADKVIVSVVVTGVKTEHQLIPLSDWNTQVAAIPNAAAAAAGGLFTRGTGAGQINQAADGMIDVSVVRLANVAQSLTDLKDFADDGYDPITNKVQGVVLTDTLTTYTGNTPQTGDSFARLGAPAGASVSADIAAIEGQTDDIGAAGAGLTAVPWNAAWDAEVESEVADALAAYDAATGGDVTTAAASVTVTGIATNTIGSGALDQTAITEIRSLFSGTADSGTTTSLTDADLNQVDADFWKGQILLITSGSTINQSRTITGFNPATDTLTVDRAFTQAITTNTYEILPAGAALVAADAVTEIQAGLATAAAVATVQADTDDIQTRLPAALVSGRIDASVGAAAANTITASALATDAVTEIQAAVAAGSVASVTGSVGSVVAGVTLAASAVQAIWDALTSALTTAGSIGKLLVDNINATISSRLATAGYTAPPTAAANADAVWDETLADHLTAGSTGSALNAAGSAGDPWNTALPGAYGAGTAGKIVGDNINATVSSRATPAQVNAEVLDVLTVDTFAEPLAIPDATSSLKDKLSMLFMALRNKVRQTETAQEIWNDAEDTPVATATVSDTGDETVRSKFES
jgi:hypothetical protein